MSAKLSEQLKVTQYLSGDASTVKDVGWVDMSGYGTFMVLAAAAALTGTGVTAFKILANAQADGGGTDVTVKTHAVGSAPDAAGDYLVLECTAEEVAAAAAAAGIADVRYVSAAVDANNAGDNVVVTYILGNPRYGGAALTSDYVSP